TYKGGGYNGILMEDATDNQRLDLQAQKDMNTYVLNNKQTQVNGQHIEYIAKKQNISIQGNRKKQIAKDELSTITLNNTVNISGNKKTVVNKQLLVSSKNGDICLSTGGSRITITKAGIVAIEGSGEVKLNGQQLYLNSSEVSSKLLSIEQLMAATLALAGENGNSFESKAEKLAKEWETQSNKIAELRANGQNELADQLDRERKALQMAILSKAAYQPIGSEPPVGWKEISQQPEELSKYKLSLSDLPIDKGFQARFFAPDSAVFGENFKSTIAFRGTRNWEDWENNIQQGLALESDYYRRVGDISKKILESGYANDMEFTGHSLGGGLASAAAMATGSKATIFNAPGVRDITVERYNRIIANNIEAYNIKHELLTRMQVIEKPELTWDYISKVPLTAPDIAIGVLLPNARSSTSYELPVQTDEHWFPGVDSYVDHGIDKVISALEKQLLEGFKSTL
ncbi:Uncharacterized protein conserved in bacteria, partial [Pasteurella testudinis DSM 23072]